MNEVRYVFHPRRYNELIMIKHLPQKDKGGKMELNISKIGDVITIILKGRIDASVAPDMEQKLLSLISEGSCKLVADLSQVRFISSAGLRTLVAALKEAKRGRGDLRLAGIQGQVQEVLDLTGLSTIFKIYTSAEDAARSFSE